jgi:hypothetical protein
MTLFIWLGPLAIIYCVYRAIKETRIKRDDMPVWLKTSILNMNTDDGWHLK